MKDCAVSLAEEGARFPSWQIQSWHFFFDGERLLFKFVLNGSFQEMASKGEQRERRKNEENQYTLGYPQLLQ